MTNASVVNVLSIFKQFHFRNDIGRGRTSMCEFVFIVFNLKNKVERSNSDQKHR